MSEASSPCSNSASQIRKTRGRSSKPRRIAQKRAEPQAVVNGSTAKRGRGRPRKAETGNFKRGTAVQAIKRSRPRFELQKPDSSEKGVVFIFALSLSVN